MYEKNPQKIEMNSMDIIEEYMGDTDFTEDQKIVAKRMIHTTEVVEYSNMIDMYNNYTDEAKKALINETIRQINNMAILHIRCSMNHALSNDSYYRGCGVSPYY